jgi:dethiobiotin synthetase
MKPIAAGAELQGGKWINEDAALLRAAGSIEVDLNDLNPYCFRSPVAPHLAAIEEGVSISPQRIAASFETLRGQADVLIVEGAGGFLVPLDEHYDTADLARDLGLPVILVVGMRLGCINHALLTVEAIRARGLALAGWVANRVDPAMLRFDDNLATLRARIDAPLLGVIPYLAERNPMEAAKVLRLPD